MEYKGITEQYQDMAGKWRVRVLITDTDTIFLKFQTEPTEQEVIDATVLYITNLEATEARLAEEAAQKAIDEEKAELVKDMTVEELKEDLGV